MPLKVDEGDELGFRGHGDLPEGLLNIDNSDDNVRKRKLREMDWKTFA